GRYREALPDWEHATELLGGNGTNTRVRHAEALVRLGRHAEAVALVEEPPAKLSGEQTVRLARVFALAAREVNAASGVAADRRKALQERYAARAVALLAEVRAAGRYLTAAALEKLA